MTTELFIALTGFAIVTSFTPGPNTMLLLASGVNHGFRPTIPHMLGVVIGFVVMLMLVGLGIGQLLRADPTIFKALKIASILYMLWLAWKIAVSGPIGSGNGGNTGKPMTFVQGALFQWVNPKAWAIALSGTAAYTSPDSFMSSLLILCIIFGVAGIPAASIWTMFGVGLRKLLQDPTRVRIFNITMGLLLALSMLPAVFELLLA